MAGGVAQEGDGPSQGTFSELQGRLAQDDLSEAEILQLMTAAVDRAPTVSAALEVVRTQSERLTGARRAEATAARAELHALRGDRERAAEAYAEASDLASTGDAGANDPTPGSAAAARYRVEEAAIRLDMGEADAAAELAEEVIARAREPRLQRRAALILARAHEAAGDSEAAYELARELSESEHSPTLQPATLLFLHRVAGRLGRDDEADRARRLLSELYPDSPEVMLVSGGGAVRDFPRPSRFFGPEARVEGTDSTDPAVAAEQDHREHTPRGVQVGSFKSMDNARDMRRETASAGFSAEIVDSEDGEFYRVIIPLPEGTDPQQLVVSLKEEGFEGFLVFDE
ncbi:MAG: SPOR domain-containing protein [Spirochaetaceae bacterium]